MASIASKIRKMKQERARRRRRHGITEAEVKDVRDMSTPRTPVIYEVVRRMGEEEMQRPAWSLWWSGVAAGLSMSFSLLAMAILQSALPDTEWRPLISYFGYPVGFLMAVLSRQQLFTESTITAVLPVAANLSWKTLRGMWRFWAIVLAANLAGTLFAALFCRFTPVLTPDLFAEMLKISAKLLELSWSEMFFRGIASGFLIAALVWIIPSAEQQSFFVITLMTYLIAAGEFTHIVAGSVEAFLLLFDGQWGAGAMIWQFMLPVLLGNMVGGTALFALIAYAQVMEEI